MGSLFKQIYRYTRPRAYRHNENLWPWVKIRRAASGERRNLYFTVQRQNGTAGRFNLAAQ